MLDGSPDAGALGNAGFSTVSAVRGSAPAAVFFAYADAPARRAALTAPPGSPERYRLFGLEDVAARGVRVRHNLERRSLPAWARLADRVARSLVAAVGGYGGDFASILASLRAANQSNVIFSTVDRVGIPLVLLAELGIVRRPIVYTAVGLPERLLQLRSKPARRVYRRALRRTRVILSYADSEVAWLRDWLGPGGPPVVFVPFGVDVHAFRTERNAGTTVDVVSVGADPHRDFELLVDLASRHPELVFHVVGTEAARRTLGKPPSNVSFESGLSLEQVRDRLAAARVVALPVKPNSYSGATTVLLQAMALAKPVVVSRTDAIAAGYGLEDRTNCRLVEPANPAAFEQALLETLADPGTLGARARETVELGFSWEQYTSELWKILSSAWEPEP
jgi:glycosyltransferase involved in cell wall biosynthesis